MERLTNEEYWEMRAILSEIRLNQCEKTIVERMIRDANVKLTAIDLGTNRLMEKKEALSKKIASRTGIDKLQKEYTISISEEDEVGEISIKDQR